MASLSLAGFSAAQANTIFQDGNFYNSDWSFTTYKSDAGHVSTNRYVSSPNSPEYSVMLLVDAPPVSPAKVLGVFRYAPATYDPATSGAVAALNFKLDSWCLGSGCHEGQIFGVALHQDGKDYISGDSNGYPAGSHSATSSGSNNPVKYAGTALTAGQFCLVSNATIAGNDYVTCDVNQHPDFSAAGPPIQCGFFAYLDDTFIPSGWAAQHVGNQHYGQHVYYDNWSCEFVPPPTGTLSVYKLILDPSGNPLVFAGPWGLSAPTFNIRANCGGQGPGSVSLTPPILAGSIPNLPYGTTCTIDEPALPSPFTNSAGDTCTWQQSAPLSQSIPINGPAQSVTVTNTFTCAPPAPTTASIRLHKSLAHPPGVMAPTGVTYDVTVTCGTSSQTLPIPTGGTPGYATTQQFLVGSSCTIQETLPSKCSWGTITYRYQLGPSAPVQTYVGNTLAFNLSGMALVDIENTLLAACP